MTAVPETPFIPGCSLAAAIRNARIARGLSQLDLANAVGITQGRLWEYENDRRDPTSRTLIAIAVALKVELRFDQQVLCSLADDTLRRATSVRSRRILNMEVQAGRVQKPQVCEECGTGKPQGHHDDYGAPLSVAWLCVKCHAKRHHPINGVSGERRTA